MIDEYAEFNTERFLAVMEHLYADLGTRSLDAWLRMRERQRSAE